MTDNLRHWNELGKTDPRHTKPFQRAGGFKGTATKPIWTEMRLTEHFGPCGIGWGCDEPIFNLVTAGEEILVFCTVRAWYIESEKQASLYGVGGDKVVIKQQSGLRSDDEAYKKAFTDALGNAFKHLGTGADVHMGLFEDSKYVNEMRKEFAEGDAPANPQSAGANGAMRPASTAGSPAQTAKAPPNSPASHGPTAARDASRSEAERAFPDDASTLSEAAAEFVTRVRKRIEDARLPARVDEIVTANVNGLARLKEQHPPSYDDLMALAAARKGELLAAA